MLTKLFTVASFAGYLFLASLPAPAVATAAAHLRSLNSRHGSISVALSKRAKSNANSKRCKAVVKPSSSITSTSKTSSAARSRVTVSVGGAAVIGAGVSIGVGGGGSGSGSGGGGGGGSAPAVPHSGKLGLVFGGDPSQLGNYGAHKNRMLYNWAVDPPYNYKSLGFNFMPMLWGEKNVQSGCEYNGGCFSKVKASDWNTVMFINEANEPGQANMGVSRAVQLWQQYMQPLANQGVRTVGPVMSSNPNGKDWTRSFYKKCSGCKVDIQPVHYYDVTASGMIQYIKDYHSLSGNKPIMVTEWACQNYNGGSQCSRDEIWSFNKEVINFMESTSWVIGYMPFGVMMGPLPDNVNQQNILMNSNGKPTALANLMGY